MEGDDDSIRVGTNVIIDLNGSKFSFIRIRQNGTVKVAGRSCSTDPILGARFGSAFLLDEQKVLVPADSNPHETIANATGTDKNNSDLVGQNSNQSLTHDEVLELKHQNKGPEILQALQQGSTTFAGKTEFSQEKWLKKKAKKYLQYVTVRRPTSDLICQVHYSTTPAKVFNMRPDTLSIMMHSANISPHARVLCLDATGGVAAAACVERMGGTGTLCCAHAEAACYPLDYARLINCPRWLAQSARHCALTALLAAQKRLSAAASQPPDKKQKTVQDSICKNEGVRGAAAEESPGSLAQLPAEQRGQGANATGVEPSTDLKHGLEGGCSMDVDGAGSEAVKAANASVCTAEAPQQEVGGAEKGAAADVQQEGVAGQEGPVAEAERPVRTARAATAQLRLGKEIPAGFKIPDVVIAAGEEDIDTLASQGFTSLVVVAPKLEPAALLAGLLPLLKSSASLAVYASSLPPLADCFQKLQATRNFAALHIQESWWREIQVLPMRTHPTMTTSGTGGYLLTGVRVIPSQRPHNVVGNECQDGQLPRRKRMRV